jgi:uncharacterized protein YndB with AHSA1/START domain
MSSVKAQALIKAPPSRIWELVGDPSRHPEWWPNVIEVRGERFDEGSNYAQVTKRPIGKIETEIAVEQLEDLHEIDLQCQTTGTYSRWLLTEAQGSTFVDVEFGMDPQRTGDRIWDSMFGTMYFRRWLSQSLAALEQVAEQAEPSTSEAPPAG